jgi:hypothetical protein
MDAGCSLIYLSQIKVIDQLKALNAGSIFVLDDCDQVIIPEFTVEITYADNCTEAGYQEQRVYSWVATDVCGNSSSLSFCVRIMDDIPPVFDQIPGDTAIICAPLPLAEVMHAIDPAQPMSIVYSESITPGGGQGVNIVTRTWTATDACGNTTIVVQHIQWIPDSFLECEINVPDIIGCNSHGVIITSDVSGGFGPYNYVWQIVGEKCFIQGGQGTPVILVYMGWSDMKIILTVTDAYGCVSMCMMIVHCVDTGVIPSTVEATLIEPESNPEHAGSPYKISLNIEPQKYLTEINLWPNPSNGSVNLSFVSMIDDEIVLRLTNFLGQTVLNSQINVLKGYNNLKIDVASLPEGNYLMDVKTGKEIHSKVIVIMRNN